MITATTLLTLVTMERIAELWLARCNTKALLKSGSIEVSPGHYPLIVLMHASWLAGLWLIGLENPVDATWLSVFLALQVIRAWVLVTLGRRWTTRIIVRPGAPLVTTGPYRYLSHPNYLVVIGEIAVLPLCLGLTWYALAFSVVNAVVLTVRIRAEDAALSELRTSAPSSASTTGQTAR
jgi:methyltransferase